MKLGVSYIVFDGIELLPYSIDQIRGSVDHICVVYQRASWFGKPIKPLDLERLRGLLKSNKIDSLIEFTSFAPLRDKMPSSIKKAKGYERAKRQTGLTDCLSVGCTHHITMDVDEFYDTAEFTAARQKVQDLDLGSTAVRFINYVSRPTIHRGYDPRRVPFICRVDHSSHMSYEFPVKCDPTRGVSPLAKPFFEFDRSVITMHHMENVRVDLRTKYESTTRGMFKRDRSSDLINIVDRIDEKSETIDFKGIIHPATATIRLTHCENKFNLPDWTWKRLSSSRK